MVTIEKAFTLSHDCELYKSYMAGKTEKQKFHDAARAFFKKYGFTEKGSYVITKHLQTTMTSEMKKQFAGQLMKYDSSDGLSLFKKNSKIQKAWEEEVVSKVNMDEVGWSHLWYWSYIVCGSYALWDRDGVVYGYLKENNGEPKLPEGAVQIKMSEYYAAYEMADGKSKVV